MDRLAHPPPTFASFLQGLEGLRIEEPAAASYPASAGPITPDSDLATVRGPDLAVRSRSMQPTRVNPNVALQVIPLWPLQNIASTNIVWCMAYKRRVGRGTYLAQYSCNTIAQIPARCPLFSSLDRANDLVLDTDQCRHKTHSPPSFCGGGS